MVFDTSQYVYYITLNASLSTTLLCNSFVHSGYLYSAPSKTYSEVLSVQLRPKSLKQGSYRFLGQEFQEILISSPGVLHCFCACCMCIFTGLLSILLGGYCQII